MISFALSCAKGHAFEAWFASSAAYEAQKLGDDIACPVCGIAEVDKALMTPAVATARAKDAVRVAANVPEPPEMVQVLRKIRKHLTDNADYVGDRFATEARRIHYEEAEQRGIYGEATKEEVHALADEGIEFHPLPVLPEDHH